MVTASRLPFGTILSERLGPPAHPAELASSPRSRVWRIELAAGPAVLKQLVAGPEADERYEREVAALRIAARAPGAPVVPRLLGTDPDERVLVLEHLDHRRPAADWIVGYAAALARLHSTAVPGDAGALPRWQGPTPADVASFLTLAETLGVHAAPGAEDELHALVERLGGAEGTALLHGDPCPGNDLHTPEGVRFIDFEQASLGSGLMELAYLRIGFPSCWCVTRASAPLLARAEAAYRSAWLAATGTLLPDTGLADACAGWLIRGDALVQRAHRGTADHLARLPDEDWEWGTATARRRLVHRLAVVAAMAPAQPGLRALTGLAAELRRAAAHRWPGLRPVLERRP
ncbi:phosphotransferase family protein [Streptomyces sp. B1I3]|uniref:phosphotransferase family protein n=1 Tax=Streptomyces sp. B1I3 TaxID=3042264 RepID=UPI002788D876|nr:aminoglycoside phosphotransferase family protein [Streptomyces sp. B1I3]MDQ0796312.1 tRNA A-37 threonylcarbamoyl transferase component Bud32 [Streptomyces sp. B1I3]